MSDALAETVRNDESRDKMRPARRWGPGIGAAVVITVAGLLAYDMRDILLAEREREEALALVQPGERITHIERVLNQAHYSTRYGDGPPAVLQVSTLDHVPYLSRLVSAIAPRTAAEQWITGRLTSMTSFRLEADERGNVRVAENGAPVIRPAEPVSRAVVSDPGW